MITDLTEAKKIIEQRFECLKKAFKEKFGEDLTESPLQKCFYYPEHLEEILKWNRNAESINDLIDLAGYNEHTIGNLEKAEIILLGSNPGSAEIFGADQENEMQKIQESVQYLSESLFDQFYPLANQKLRRFKNYFPNRLIPRLKPFLQSDDDIYKFAPYVASAELSPYHTRYFKSKIQEISEEKNRIVHDRVKAGMERGVLFIALFVDAKNKWIRKIPELRDYENFYFCHNKQGERKANFAKIESVTTPGRRANQEFNDKIKKCVEKLYGETEKQPKQEGKMNSAANDFVEYWEKTAEADELNNLLANPQRFVLEIDGRSYPCWIGHKTHGGGNAALLIAKKNDERPPRRRPDRQPVSLAIRGNVLPAGYVLYHFWNGNQRYETYVEFKNYMWANENVACLYHVADDGSMRPVANGNIPSNEINRILEGFEQA